MIDFLVALSFHDGSGSPAMAVCAIAPTEKSDPDIAANRVEVERAVRRVISGIRRAFRAHYFNSRAFSSFRAVPKLPSW